MEWEEEYQNRNICGHKLTLRMFLVHKRQRHLYALISNATLILLITWAGTMAIDHMTEQYWDLGKLHVGIETYMPMSHIRQ